MTGFVAAAPATPSRAAEGRLPAAGPIGRRRRALALSVIVAGTFMTLLDSTIVNVALVPIGRDLGTTTGVEWIAGAYVMALAVAQPVAGWLGDRFGRKTVFLTCIAGFALTSAAVAACSRLDLLIVFRILQGLAGGGVLPISMAMILELFRGPEYARATAAWAMAATVAPTLGPAFGGWLATAFGWRSLFLVNTPIGLATVIVGVCFLPAVRAPRPARFDAGGFVLGSGGLACLMLGLGQGVAWGWSSVGTLLGLGVGAAMAGGFVARELSTRHPLIEIRMLADRGFRLAMSVSLLAGMVHSSRLVFLPLQLENVRGYTPLRVGLLFIPAGIVNTAAMWLGGRLPQRLGLRRTTIVGTSIMLVALSGFGMLTPTTPDWLIVVLLGAQGMGFGLMFPAVMVIGLGDLPPRLISAGTAIRSVVNQSASAFAVALIGSVIAVRSSGAAAGLHDQTAYNTGFLVAALLVLGGLICALRLPRALDDDAEQGDGRENLAAVVAME